MEIAGLRFTHRFEAQSIKVLNGLDHEVEEGDFQLVSGPSGSGRSTFMNLLGLIEPLQDGEIRFGSLRYTIASEAEKDELRRKCFGFIFQNFNLFPVLNALENVVARSWDAEKGGSGRRRHWKGLDWASISSTVLES